MILPVSLRRQQVLHASYSCRDIKYTLSDIFEAILYYYVY